MNEKEKLLMKAKEELDAKVTEIASKVEGGEITDFLSARAITELLNEPYDAEVPCAEVIVETAEMRSIVPGEVAEYFTQSASTKTVYTVTNGSITQAQVSPGSASTLSLSVYESPEDYLYLNDMLTQKYDSLANKAKDQHEGLNRLENKTIIDLYFAAAESESNTFANDSGDAKIDYKKLVDMVRSLAKYGKGKFVLVSGTAVTTDLILMDYDDNKQREVNVTKAGISKWIKVENFTYAHSGTQTVMPTDRALVIATSDSEDNRPALFVRRKMPTTISTDPRERFTVATGPRTQIGTAVKLAFSLITVESFGAVVTNALCFAAYQDATSYTNL
jgi:hypothetical protein